MDRVNLFLNGLLRINAFLMGMLGGYFGIMADYDRGAYLMAFAAVNLLMAREP